MKNLGGVGSRTTQETKKSGNAFKKKVTTIVKGWVKPDWFVATPVEMQTEGAMVTAICVASTQTTTSSTGCDDPAHVAISGIAVTQWTGGNMPIDEEMVYQWSQTKSSFTVLFFSVVLGLLTWGLATAYTGGFGLTVASTASEAAAASGVSAAAGGSTLAGGFYGLVAGIGYSILSTGLHSGGGLTQAQSGLFGSTGNGVLQINLAALSQQSQGLAKGVRNRHVKSAQGYNLTGSQKLFKGTCAEGKTVAECWGLGLDAGQMWRGDTYQEVNMTLQMRAKFNDCKQQGFTGAALRQCAAPNSTAWQP